MRRRPASTDDVADLLSEHHLALIRSGAGRTLLHWARTLPDDVLSAHPEVAVASAITTLIMGAGTMERRRYAGSRAELGFGPEGRPRRLRSGGVMSAV